MPRKMDWKSGAALAVGILPLGGAALAQVPAQQTAAQLDGSVEQTLDEAMRRLEQAKPHKEVYVDPQKLDTYVGYYQLELFRAYAVARLGDRLYVQLTGQEFVPLFPESANKFFFKGLTVPVQISFATDAQGQATGLTVHRAGAEWVARRIEEADAKALQETFTKRIKEPTPMPGSEAALRRQIAAFQQGQPAYHEMSGALASGTRPQVPAILKRMAIVGPLRSISFRGVGLDGLDIYEAKFENGMSICRISMAEDGKVSSLLLQW